MSLRSSILAVALPLALLCGCAHSADGARPAAAAPGYVGTTEPMAADAVYFVVTDRYVNGDPSNDQRDQGRDKGAAYFTFDRPTPGAEAEGELELLGVPAVGQVERRGERGGIEREGGWDFTAAGEMRQQDRGGLIEREGPGD